MLATAAAAPPPPSKAAPPPSAALLSSISNVTAAVSPRAGGDKGGDKGGGEGGGEAAPLAAKLSSPANLWEWSVHCALRERLAAPARRWMPLALAVHDLARGASSVLLTPVVANPNPNP